MSSTQVSTEQRPTTGVPTAATVDLKLEAILIPVSDVDRAKTFYCGLGWRLDADFVVGENWRVVQLTLPDRHARSISARGTTAVPGSPRNVYLVVSDIEAARRELIARGVDVSQVFHFDGRAQSCARSGPELRLLRLIRLIQRSGRQSLGPSTGQDAPSRTRNQPGRRDADRASTGNREAPRLV